MLPILFIKKRSWFFVVLAVALALGAFFWFFYRTSRTAPESPTSQSSSPLIQSLLSQPINRAGERVIKKPFGIYVTPQHSPVSPEKFTGYHTGTDFETFADEQTIDVPVFAICDGTVLEKTTTSGYGGVAVEECQLENQTVTVIYGHLRLSSITIAPGQTLRHGEQLGVLGTGYSRETDGERKHLHLSIHKGATIELRGYVQQKSQLSAWLGFETLI